MEMPDLNSFLTAAGISLTGMVALAYPLMKLVRIWSKDRADNTKDGAEAVLYSHLSDQVRTLSDNLEKSRDENTKLHSELSSLRTRVLHLEGIEAINLKFKVKLDEKDSEIGELNIRIVNLTSELVSLTKDNSELRVIIAVHTNPQSILPFGVSNRVSNN